MKRKLFLVMAAILAAGLLFTGCGGGGGGDDPPPYYGENLVTEAAILAATGTGVDSVTKVSDGVYTVTGTVTAWENWDQTQSDKRIALEIPADPDDPDAFFANANRYGVKINFPNSSVKPIPDYTDGFRIYLENIKATENTPAWKGTWQHEWPDEYNAIGGVGTMTINRDLSVDGDGDPIGSEVADYQHLVIVLMFEDVDEGEEYTFTISNVAVYGDSISPLAEFPVIHETSELDPAEYELNDTAADLKVVCTWTANSSTYTYQWYSNTTSSNTGGTEIQGETSATFTPPTDTEGTVYYYCVISYTAEGTSNRTGAIRIIVGPVTLPEDLWSPDPVAAPGGYVDFPSASILAATFYPSTGASIVAGAGGTYTVTAKTSATHTEITFPGGEFEFKDGYYLSASFPTNPAYKPPRLYTYISTPQNWGSADDINAPTGKFIGGDVDFHWAGTTTRDAAIQLQIYWEAGTPADQNYVFTLKALKVAEEVTGPAPDPNAWTPEPVADPGGAWVTPSIVANDVTYYPWKAAGSGFVSAGGSSYTATVVTQSSGHSTITIPVAFTGGYYLSITLPSTGDNKVTNVVTQAENASATEWGSEIQTKSDGKYVVGRVDNKWEGASDEAPFTKIVLGLYWAPGTTADEDYEFTINALKVAEQ